MKYFIWGILILLLIILGCMLFLSYEEKKPFKIELPPISKVIK